MIISYEKSLKELDSESRTKKELEIRMRQLESELDERRSAEIRYKTELTSANEKHNKAQVERLGKLLIKQVKVTDTVHNMEYSTL